MPDTPSRVRPPVDPAVRIGHVHLKVADLERSIDFYGRILGFENPVSDGTFPVGIVLLTGRATRTVSPTG